jgi:hypothetical protein
MATPASTLITEAAANGYPGLSDRALLECLLVALTSGSSGGGATSGTGSPVGTTPSSATAIYFDTTNPAAPVMWLWANSTWTQILG